MIAARVGQVLLSALLLGLLAALPAPTRTLAASGEACGRLETNTTWSGSVTVTCDVTVPAGLTLTVAPGTTVSFQEWTRIEVSGALIADGSSSPIVFTSSQASPEPDWWRGIGFVAGSTGLLDNVQVRYAGRYGAFSGDSGIRIDSSNVTVRNSTIASTGGHGIYIVNAAPTITSNTFTANHDSALYFYASQPVAAWNPTANHFNDNLASAARISLSDYAGDITFTGNLVSDNALNGIRLTGTINGSATISGQPDFPFIVDNNATLYVLAGADLTITPGSVLKFQEWARIEVSGNLTADASTGSPIYFTDVRDDTVGGDTNNDGADSAPAADWWRGIGFVAGSTGLLDNVQVRYAGRYGAFSGDMGVRIDSSDVTVQNSTIASTGGYGIYVYNAAPTITSNTFTANHDSALYFYASQPVAAWNPTANHFNDNLASAARISLSDYAGDITFTGNLVSDNALNGIRLTGTINGSATISGQPDFPFIVDNNATLYVLAGADLTITPGSVLKFQEWARIEVSGNLTADASTGSPIYFTDVRDDTVGGDTNNDGADSAPAADWWRGIGFVAGSTGLLDNVQVRYAGRYGAFSGDMGVRIDSSDVTVQNSTIASTGGYGIYVYNAAPTITSNTFTANHDSALYFYASQPVAAWNPTSNHFADNLNSAARISLSDYAGDITFTGNLVSDNALNGIRLTGTINGSATISGQPDFPFIVDNNATLYVLAGADLTITPGSVLKFQEWARIEVSGNLTADASTGSPIYFTDVRDDTVGGDTNNDDALGPDESASEPDWWRGIGFVAGSTGLLDNVQVRYAGRYGAFSGDMGIRIDSSDVTVRNSTIASTGGYGIYVYNAAPTITSNTFTANHDSALYFYASQPVGAWNPTSNHFADNLGSAARISLSDYAGDIAFTGNTWSNNALNGIGLAGTITGTATLTGQADFPFIVDNNATLYVLAGADLTITPGSVLKFQEWARIEVSGNLTADASTGSPIYFTDVHDDTVGGDTNNDDALGPDESASEPDWWRGIGFVAGSTGLLDNVQVRYAGRWGAFSGDMGVRIDSSDVTVRNSTITSTGGFGIYVSGAAPSITYNTFTANETGIRTGSGAAPLIRNNQFSGNSDWAIYNGDSSVCLDARENWWGDATGPADASSATCACGLGENAGLGDAVSNNVRYSPWLTSATGAAVATPTPVPTATPTLVPAATPAPAPTPTRTPTATATPTPMPLPTATPTPSPTAMPTPVPTAAPTATPGAPGAAGCINFNTLEWTDLSPVFAGAGKVLGMTNNKWSGTGRMHLWFAFDAQSPRIDLAEAPPELDRMAAAGDPNWAGEGETILDTRIDPRALLARALADDGVPLEHADRLVQATAAIRVTVHAPDHGYHSSYLLNFDPPPLFAIGTGEVDDTAASRVQVCSVGAPPLLTATPVPGEIAAGTLAVGSRTVAPHGAVRVPVRFVDAGDVASMNFNLTYDPQVLEVMKVERGSLLPGALFQPNTRESGIIRFGLASTTGRTGTGTLAYITFLALADEGTTPLTLSDVFVTDAADAAISPGLSHGAVTIEDKTLKGDWNGDGKVTELDALAALKISVGLLDENLALDMDGDGRITASDARQILQIAVRTGGGR